MADRPGQAGLSRQDLADIHALEEIVNRYDRLALKLNWELMRERPPGEVDDFLVREGETLVGYAALDGDGGEYELTGMVHPDFRRGGIGRRLLDAAIAACRSRGVEQLLVVCEHASVGGQAFVTAQGDRLRYAFSEFRLERDAVSAAPETSGVVQLRPATAENLLALARIRAAAFGDSEEQGRADVARQFAEPGSRIFVGEVGGEMVGTIGAIEDDGGIYLRALAVAPERQGRGYGRAILSSTVALMLSEGYTRMALDVETENRNALSLYLSCGFIETNQYDYFRVKLS